MSRSRFRYALEPVLLTRRWALDALLATLTAHNAQMTALAAEEARVKERYQGARAAWQAMSGGREAQPVQRFALNAGYLGELARQLRTHSARLDELAGLRDELIGKVVSAQRAVEAAEQHRQAMQDLFIQRRLRIDFQLADDQWNTQHTGASGHDHTF